MNQESVRKARFTASGWTVAAVLWGILAAHNLLRPGSSLLWTTLFAFIANTLSAVIAWRNYNRIKQEENDHE